MRYAEMFTIASSTEWNGKWLVNTTDDAFIIQNCKNYLSALERVFDAYGFKLSAVMNSSNLGNVYILYKE